MGNCIEQYRAAIGLFNLRDYSFKTVCYTSKSNDYSMTEILLTNFRCSFLVVSLCILQSLSPNINIIFLLFVLEHVLIIGNIETNPGPNSESGSTSIVN